MKTQVPTRKKRLDKWALRSWVVGSISLAVSCALVVVALVYKPTVGTVISSPEAMSQTAAAINANATLSNAQRVSSSLGYAVSYDAAQFTVRAQTTDPASTDAYIFGESFEGDELKTERDYSSIIFGLKSTADNKDTSSLSSFDKLDIRVSTNIRSDFFTTREAQAQYRGLDKIGILEKYMTMSRQKNEGVAVSDSADVSINGIAYKKITYTTTIESKVGLDPYISSEVVYITVQNGRPYWATIGLVTDRNSSDVSLFEPIVAAISYPASDAMKGESYAHTSAGTIQIPKGASYVPQPISEDTIVSVVLVNQPAVVRIGTLRCSEAKLMLTDGTAGYIIDKACVAAVGSGSIVSKEGYVATNGHVVTVGDKVAIENYATGLLLDAYKTYDFTKVEAYLDYFIKAELIDTHLKDVFIAYLEKKDSSAINDFLKLITYLDDSKLRATGTTEYVVQLSNDPIRLTDDDGSHAQFGLKYSDTNVPATLVDLNYDESLNLAKGFGTKSDVAILKLDQKKEYPVVELGSIRDIKAESRITALGYPAFVDGSFRTKQDKTVPAVTQGHVKEIGQASADTSYQLIQTTVPIAGGNSGGPAFDDAGKQVGLNTYGSNNCPDKKCFGDGIARDIADLQELATKNSISLKTDSRVSQSWRQAIGLFAAGNYEQATKKFKESAQEYPANYLAPIFATIAEKRIGSADDTSGDTIDTSSFITLALVGFGIFIVLTATGVIIIVIRRKRHASLPVAPAVPVSLPVSEPASQPVPAAPLAPSTPTEPIVPVVPTTPVTPTAPPPATPSPMTPPAPHDTPESPEQLQ